MNLMHFIEYLILLFVYYTQSDTISIEETELQLVQIIFRHGERTPIFIYPTDPHNITIWEKYGGLGHLTQEGMRQVRELGIYLRNHYRNFLSNYYNPMEATAYSTDFDRTLMSTYSLLSGLYPPIDFQVFDPKLKWQPIAVHTNNIETDQLFHVGSCQKIRELRRKIFETDEYKRVEEAHQNLLKLIKLKSGYQQNVTLDVLTQFGDTLYIEKSNNLTLPDWAEENYDKIVDMLHTNFHFYYRLPEMARLTTGGVVNDMRTNIIKKVENKTRQQLFLYGAHDSFVAALTKLLNISTYINQPPYAATLIVELRRSIQIENDYFVQVLFKNNTPIEPISFRKMTIYGCEQLCQLDKFLEITRSKVVLNFNEECKQT